MVRVRYALRLVLVESIQWELSRMSIVARFVNDKKKSYSTGSLVVGCFDGNRKKLVPLIGFQDVQKTDRKWGKDTLVPTKQGAHTL